MRFWDTSALVPLMVNESQSERMRALISEDPHITAWAWSWVEIVSAVERRAREGDLTRPHRRAALDRFAELAESYDEVTDLLAVRRRATALLARHPLRAADAAQLGAALLVAPEDGPQLEFVCLDARLLEAAEREGLFPLPS